ncbi:unnamed protein product, partial [Polarella glacialis]
ESYAGSAGGGMCLEQALCELAGLPKLQVDLLGSALLGDMRTVLELDRWENNLSGQDWIKNWWTEGSTWAEHLEQSGGKGPHYCKVCWMPCSSAEQLRSHSGTAKHGRRPKV